MQDRYVWHGSHNFKSESIPAKKYWKLNNLVRFPSVFARYRDSRVIESVIRKDTGLQPGLVSCPSSLSIFLRQPSDVIIAKMVPDSTNFIF